MSKVLTANRLSDGAVVYLAPGGEWAEALFGAQLLLNVAEFDAALAAGADAERHLLVVHPYLMEVRETGLGLQPVRMREIIRAAGPTIRKDLGKQADLIAAAG